MKKIFTLFAVACAFLSSDLVAQCTSSSSTYDLVVFNNTNISQSSSMAYISAYVCGGAVLTDSAMCCTRICHVDTLGTLVVGPMSYGTVYLKSGATFNGQNTAQNWFVYAEPGATVLNYSGNVVQCTTVTFPAAMCFMSVPEQYQSTVSAVQSANLLSFSFSSVLTEARVELYDASGKIVMTSTQAQCNRQDLEVSTLPSGVYMYRIYDGEEAVASDRVILVK